MKKILPVLLFSLLVIQCVGPKRVYKRTSDTYSQSEKNIRVLLNDSFSGKLSFKVPVNAYSSPENSISVSAGQTLTVRNTSSGIIISSGSRSITGDRFTIEPDLFNDLLDLKGRQYRGSFVLQLFKGNICLINYLDIEDYLKSVIYSEMGVASGDEDFEALKAFAVCIRNYTVMKQKENRKSVFDVYGDKRDQVYSGFESEKGYTNRAIIETRGLVLEYNGQPAKTFYFASCGGFTEDCDNVFREKGVDYLCGVQDGGEHANCSISPSFSWKEEYTSEQIVKMLYEGKYISSKACAVENISVKSRYHSGRVNELEIILSDGSDKKKVILVGNLIRYVIKSQKNGSLLKSTMFQVETQRNRDSIRKITIIGKGNGHGVGFCQWGAIGLSRQGKEFDEILYTYFPGTRLEKI